MIAAGGAHEPLAPNLPEKKRPSREFVHGIGPGGGHVAMFLFVPSERIDRLAKGFNEIGEYVAFKTPDGRSLVLLDPDYSPVNKDWAFKCAGAATD
jgi:hypothetical protein